MIFDCYSEWWQDMGNLGNMDLRFLNSGDCQVPIQSLPGILNWGPQGSGTYKFI